jgi:EmrB/QacA subfamily drug resistance transporter
MVFTKRRVAHGGGVVLVLLCAASFIAVLDTTIVSIALPSLRRDLDLSREAVQWVLNAYTLTFGGLLLLGGRVADLFGRRRVFMSGLAVFAVSSFAGGLAADGWMLIAARFSQGLGAAALAPTSLALVTTHFADGDERNRALGAYSAMAGLGFVTGMLLGGVLTELLSWRWVMFVNVPVALAVFVLAPAALSESREPDATRGVDVPGAVALPLGLGIVIYGLTKTNDWGWAPDTVGFIGVGVTLLCAWVVIELRSSVPLVPLNVFRIRGLFVANTVMMLKATVGISQLFILTLYFQDVLGKTPMQTGIIFIPMTATSIAAAVLGGRLVSRLGPKTTATLGLVLLLGGIVLMAQLSHDGALALVLTGMVVAEGGFMLAEVPMTLVASTSVEEARRGLAGGILNTSLQLGHAVGLGAIAAIVTARAASVSGSSTGSEALVSGFRYGLVGGAGFVCLALIVLIGFLPRTTYRAWTLT